MHSVLPLLVTIVTALQVVSGNERCQRQICYFENTVTVGTTKETALTYNYIDPTLCTHIMYHSVVLRNGVVVPVEGYADSANTSLLFYKKFIDMKKKKPGLKLLLTYSGETCVYEPFLSMVLNLKLRTKFIADLLAYVRRHQFDGVNLRCWFNTIDKVREVLKNAFTRLVVEINNAIKKEKSQPKLLFSIDVYGEKVFDSTVYSPKTISNNVDWINVLAYDLHGYWHPTTGHHSPIFSGKGNRYSFDEAYKFWTKEGATKSKLVFSLSTFARTFTLLNSSTQIGAPAVAGGKGPFTKTAGKLAYFEVCRLLADKETKVVHLKEGKVPYLISGNQWVGYDDPTSVTAKITFIKKRNLGGFIMSQLNYDDFTGKFCNGSTYPLLRAAIRRCNRR